MCFIIIHQEGEFVTIKDDYGNKMRYCGYSRDEAIQKFKDTFHRLTQHGLVEVIL